MRTLRYALRRLLVGALMLLALSMVVFVLLRLTPGDPVDAYVNPSSPLSPQDLLNLRASLGLDRPLPVQYLIWLREALQGDLGYASSGNGDPVLPLVLSRVGPTLLLMAVGLSIAVLAGMSAGVLGAVRRNGAADLSLSVLALAGISAPSFLLALIGLYVFAVRLGWAPSGGMETPGEPFSLPDLLRHLILPACLLSIGHGALVMRYTRGAMLEVLDADYVRTARAKGVREVAVIGLHALRNALLPVVTLIGSTIGLAVGGAVFIESVFNWPGMGLLLVTAVRARDYPVIMGATLVVGACVLLANILTDLIYVVIDPRIEVA
ncbi:ABC transporter permease [Roseomonas elaeocarpi]|uniref:ABC transporter permease n=1 Tax=Roseomonas elaeocarpi TaxID=907779 RepID=A0ABV6JMU8_9PROT